MTPLLPQINDNKHYYSLFKDNSNWDLAIEFLVQKHSLSGAIARGTMGSHIVYRVGEVWIKLMAPIFQKEMIYEVAGLKTLSGRLFVETPAILAEGAIEGWPYIVLSHVQGEPIKASWSRLTSQQKKDLALQIGQLVAEIRTIQADEVIKNRFDWNSFIRDQYNNCEAEQKRKLLPESWLANVKTFLSQFELSEFQSERPVFLHADLTYDHFLVSSAEKPQLVGIIDMADCQVGHPEYELCAPCTFTFVKDRDQLRNFLISSGFNPSVLDKRFSEKLMAWGLLHRYFGIVSRFKSELDSLPAGDFSALAQLLYPLE